MEQIYNKLVRDNILNIIEANGEVPIYRELSYAEFWNYLLLNRGKKKRISR